MERPGAVKAKALLRQIRRPRSLVSFRGPLQWFIKAWPCHTTTAMVF